MGRLLPKPTETNSQLGALSGLVFYGFPDVAGISGWKMVVG